MGAGLVALGLGGWVGGARGPVQEPGPPPSPSASVSTVTCALGFCPGLAVCLCPVTSSYHSANGNTLCRGEGCFSLAFVSTAFSLPGQNTIIWSAHQVCLWMTHWILDKTGEQTPRQNVHSVGTVAHGAVGGALSSSPSGSHSAQAQSATPRLITQPTF